MADDLKANYENLATNCGSTGRPAFLCSGVMLRGTKMSEKYHVWDPSPRSITQGGVSFSYIRKDAKLRQLMLSFSSGIIFYPSSLKPEGKDRAESLCSFPIDGATDGRAGEGGCEAHYSYPNDSENCQSQGIYDANTWFSNYTSIAEHDVNRRTHQCGFNVRIGTANSSTIFNESLKAQSMIFNGALATTNNEIVVRTWATDVNGKTVNPEKLPIQAFFYTNEEGLIAARYYQKDYYNQVGVLVPIVRLTFPQNINQDVVFNYFEADQQKITCKIN